jgi:hypothetical protein
LCLLKGFNQRLGSWKGENKDEKEKTYKERRNLVFYFLFFLKGLAGGNNIV